MFRFDFLYEYGIDFFLERPSRKHQINREFLLQRIHEFFYIAIHMDHEFQNLLCMDPSRQQNSLFSKTTHFISSFKVQTYFFSYFRIFHWNLKPILFIPANGVLTDQK